jgi:hypothetical protein
MALHKWIKKNLAWIIGIIGVSLTIFFGIFGLYSFFHERKPNISVEITNETNVLDVRKPIKALSITFQGEDIQEKALNLRIYRIRIENVGAIDILQNHYDKDDIWGLKIEGGKIIEVRLVDSNSEYLNENLNPQLFDPDTIKFNKIIFERERFFTIEMLVLHSKKKPPRIISLGKIAGIDKIVPSITWLEQEKESFLNKISYGNIFIHGLRFFAYLCVLSLLLVLAGIFVSIFTSIKTKRRTKIVKRRLQIDTEEETENMKLILDAYVRGGIDYLKQFRNLLEDEKAVLLTIQKENEQKDYNKIVNELDKLPYNSEVLKEVSKLKQEDLITIMNGNKIFINKEIKENINNIVNKLDIKKK